jgi:hypothetical protein
MRPEFHYIRRNPTAPFPQSEPCPPPCTQEVHGTDHQVSRQLRLWETLLHSLEYIA